MLPPRFAISLALFVVSSIILIALTTGVKNREEKNYTRHYMSTIFRVTANIQNPYYCTQIRNYVCQESSELPSCDNLQQKAEAGPCNNGYNCCHSKSSSHCYSYQCNCHKCNGYCDRPVNNERCESYKSLCYHPYYTVQFFNDVYEKTVNINKTTSCSIDNMKCVTKFPVGK